MTVGAMNMAGCAPFVMSLWAVANTPEYALRIITDPVAIIVMYSAAGLGYLIDWSMTGIVATFLTQKGKARVQDIEKLQAALVERWGPEVTGEIPIDSEGFPLETPDSGEEESEEADKKAAPRKK